MLQSIPWLNGGDWKENYQKRGGDAKTAADFLIGGISSAVSEIIGAFGDIGDKNRIDSTKSNNPDSLDRILALDESEESTWDFVRQLDDIEEAKLDVEYYAYLKQEAAVHNYWSDLEYDAVSEQAYLSYLKNLEEYSEYYLDLEYEGYGDLIEKLINKKIEAYARAGIDVREDFLDVRFEVLNDDEYAKITLDSEGTTNAME